MRLIRPALILALLAATAACAQQQATGPRGLPESITLRNTQTGATRTVSGATAAVSLAVRELARRNYALAIGLATEAINSRQLAGTELSFAHAVRGDAYFLADNAAKARDDWRLAIELHPQNALALRGMGLISQMQRKMPEALGYMDRAVAASPESPHIYILRGLVRMDGRPNYGLAMADFEKAIALKPDLAAAYFYRGLVHHLSGRLAQAKAEYERALEINPAERRARDALGLLERQARTTTRPAVPRGPQVFEF